MSSTKWAGEAGGTLTPFGRERMLNWIQRLEPQVSKSTRRKGRDYYESGSVAISDGSDTQVEATVQGSVDYDVEIKLASQDKIGRAHV